MNSSLEGSFRWLIDVIEESWPELNSRVMADSEEQVAAEADSMKASIDRTKAKQQFIAIETSVPTGSSQNQDNKRVKRENANKEIVNENSNENNKTDEDKKPDNTLLLVRYFILFVFIFYILFSTFILEKWLFRS